MGFLKFIGPVAQGVFRLGRAIRKRRLRRGKRIIFKNLGRQSLEDTAKWDEEKTKQKAEELTRLGRELKDKF